jgi:hypothetical protein
MEEVIRVDVVFLHGSHALGSIFVVGSVLGMEAGIF